MFAFAGLSTWCGVGFPATPFLGLPCRHCVCRGVSPCAVSLWAGHSLSAWPTASVHSGCCA